MPDDLKKTDTTTSIEAPGETAMGLMSPTTHEQRAEDSQNDNGCTNGESPTSGPSPEQKEYWKADLRLKRWSLVVSGLGFLLVIVSLGLNTRQQRIAFEQEKIALEQEKIAVVNARSGVQQSMTKLTNDLAQIWVTYPELRPYFNGCKEIHEKDKNYQRVEAIAFMTLNLLDIAEEQNKPDLRNQWGTPQAWDEWISDMFAESPILRKLYAKRHTWYGDGLARFAEEGKKKAARTPAPCN